MRKSSLNQQFVVRVSMAVLILSLFLNLDTRSAFSQSEPQLAVLSAIAPVVDCAKLADVDISSQVGAKTHITSATVIPDAKPAAYCRITGYVEPMNKFEVRLPMTTWTQRFVQTGCGGLCGNLNIRLSNDDGCYPAQHGELALASTDMGHTGGNDGEFGEKDYQLRIDFAYRGVHVTTLAAKTLIAKFYGQPARFSYFAGCSDGGREALMEAQRYPGDFNGITAGAPAMNFTTQNTFYHGWNALRNMSADGKAVLTAAQLPTLHRAIVQQCDAADGLRDGLISDPFSCHPDPSAVECKAGQSGDDCLTHEQVETARAIYEGAHDDKGNKMVISGPLPGSELSWAGVYIPSANNPRTMSPGISAGTLKYLAYSENPTAGYQLSDLKFTPESFAATTTLHNLYDATDPDLGPYAKAGGKLILWHGMADPHISPLNTVAYYNAMNHVMGELKVKDFTRLYLFPGGYHCNGGEGPFNVDLMSAIMSWVEKGVAPNALIASHTPAPPMGPPGMLRGDGGPLPRNGAPDGPPPINAVASKADRTRPVYPYPLTAKYNGKGSVDDAQNYSIGPAVRAPESQLRWLGASFYTPHYETWCTGDGAKMTCSLRP